MSEIGIEKILSVSSEDPAFPADNLLKKDVKNSKWKTKTPGERQASVVLQLEKASKIEGLDIGNENSAFVEVLVGKSCNDNDEFKVLLVSSSLMTLKEAKEGININSVRFFKTSDFCKPECNEKWDRVKIVCTQPYNKYVKFGIGFITFHGEKKTDPPKCSLLGNFKLKEESSSDIQVGSIFARRKELLAETPPKTGAAAIRAATNDIIKGQVDTSSTPKAKKVPKKDPESHNVASTSKLNKRNNDSSNTQSHQTPVVKKDLNQGQLPPIFDPDEDIDDFLAHSESEYEPSSSGSEDEYNVQLPPLNLRTKTKANTPKDDSESPARKKTKNSPGDKRNINNPSTSVAKQTAKRVTRPFNKLFHDVVFAISGFQNPLRGDIRHKALSMGAKYKADWDSSCTHLICAFTNTPKFNQVKGHGKIAKKDWIEESYRRRIRFPWRRYALDPGDMQRAESEDEVYEEDASSSRADHRRRLHSSEEEQEGPQQQPLVQPPSKPPPMFPQMPARKPNGVKNSSQVDSESTSKPKPKREAGSPVSKSPKKKLKQEECEHGPAAPPVALSLAEPEPCQSGDTESDPEWEGYVQQSCHPLPYLPEQFTDLNFYLSHDYSTHEKDKLRRYILSHSGVVSQELDSEVEYIIAENPETVNKWKEKYPQLTGVKSEWIWRCHDENRLLPTSKFEL